MKLISTIDGCIRYAIDKGNIIYINSDRNINNNGSLIEGEYYAFNVYGKKIWTGNNQTNITEVYDLATNKLIYLSLDHLSIRPDIDIRNNSDNILAQFGLKSTWSLISIHDYSFIKQFSDKYGLNGIWQITSDDLFLSWNKESIAGCNLSNGSIAWQKNYKELLLMEDAEQSGNVVYLNGKIYLLLHSQNSSKSTTFCLDEKTGSIIKKYPNFGGFFSVSGDIIYRAHNYTVGIIDTTSNTASIYDFKDLLEPEKLWIHNRTSILSSEGLIYFVDGATITGSRFGILDLKNHKLLWTHKLKIKSKYKRINSLQLSENRLYVHADDDTLHIFERED